METFAERLKYYRQRAGYSQKELAVKIGINFAAYNNYETKGAQPKIEILIKLSNALGIDVNTLVGFQKSEKEYLLSLLRYADINYEIDPDDQNAIFIENDVTDDKKFRMEVAAHLTFKDLQEIITEVQKEMDKTVSPIFYRIFQSFLFAFKMQSDYDPKDRMVWPSGLAEITKEKFATIDTSAPDTPVPSDDPEQ